MLQKNGCSIIQPSLFGATLSQNESLWVFPNFLMRPVLFQNQIKNIVLLTWLVLSLARFSVTAYQVYISQLHQLIHALVLPLFSHLKIWIAISKYSMITLICRIIILSNSWINHCFLIGILNVTWNYLCALFNDLPRIFGPMPLYYSTVAFFCTKICSS